MDQGKLSAGGGGASRRKSRRDAGERRGFIGRGSAARLHELGFTRSSWRCRTKELSRTQQELEASRSGISTCTIWRRWAIHAQRTRVDPGGKPNGAKLFGVARGVLVKQPYRALSPEDQTSITGTAKHSGNGRPQSWALRVLKKDAVPFWCG